MTTAVAHPVARLGNEIRCAGPDSLRSTVRLTRLVAPDEQDRTPPVPFHDHTSGTLFSADSFGALLQAPIMDAADVAPSERREGMALWTTIDSPWLTHTDRRHLRRTIGDLRRLDARRVLSSHLPPATGLTAQLLDDLGKVPGSAPWVGPDQAALDALLGAVGG